ncbi:calcium-binding protein [Sesbania bispinosa]|nr:calcium-binding protein [Sesbania bispinosa]
MPIFARIQMTWTHGALWAYDADREEILYRGWLNLLIYHPSRHRAVAPLPFRNPLELTFSVPPGFVREAPQPPASPPQQSSQGSRGSMRTRKEDLEEEEDPENEPVARSDDAVVLDVGSGGPRILKEC